MHFEFENKQYNFKKLDSEYQEGFTEGKVDVRNDLYIVSYQEEETGLIVQVQAGLDIDFDNKDYEVNSKDTVVHWDYSEFTLPDDIDFDEDWFEVAFEEKAEKEAANDLSIKVANDEIPEVVEAIGNQIKEEPKQERSSRRRNRP